MVIFFPAERKESCFCVRFLSLVLKVLFSVSSVACILLLQMSDIVGYNIKPEPDSTLYQMVETGIGKFIEKYELFSSKFLTISSSLFRGDVSILVNLIQLCLLNIIMIQFYSSITSMIQITF